VGVVDLEAIADIDKYDELADAMDELSRAVDEVQRVGYRIGYHWYDRREEPVDEPVSCSFRLRRWAEKVREWGTEQIR
jgi:hypothetical protein